MKTLSYFTLAAGISAAAILTGCGVSTASVDQNRLTGVSDSGYPPKGSGTDPGSPAVSGNHQAGTITREEESGMPSSPSPEPLTGPDDADTAAKASGAKPSGLAQAAKKTQGKH